MVILTQRAGETDTVSHIAIEVEAVDEKPTEVEDNAFTINLLIVIP